MQQGYPFESESSNMQRHVLRIADQSTRIADAMQSLAWSANLVVVLLSVMLAALIFVVMAT